MFVYFYHWRFKAVHPMIYRGGASGRRRALARMTASTAAQVG